MRIIIQCPDNSSASFIVLGREISKAMEVLRGAYIPTDGDAVGWNRDAFGALTLRYPRDASRAIKVLTRAGIKASAE